MTSGSSGEKGRLSFAETTFQQLQVVHPGKQMIALILAKRVETLTGGQTAAGSTRHDTTKNKRS
jgi:hypothetical protein